MQQLNQEKLGHFFFLFLKAWLSARTLIEVPVQKNNYFHSGQVRLRIHD